MHSHQDNFIVSFALFKALKSKLNNEKTPEVRRKENLTNHFGVNHDFLRKYVDFVYALDNKDIDENGVISSLQTLHQEQGTVPKKDDVSERLFLQIKIKKITGFYVWEPESKDLCNFCELGEAIQLSDSFTEHLRSKVKDTQKNQINNNQDLISTNNNVDQDHGNNSTNNQTESNKRLYVEPPIELNDEFIQKLQGKDVCYFRAQNKPKENLKLIEEDQSSKKKTPNKKTKTVKIKKKDVVIDREEALLALPEKVGNVYFQRKDDENDKKNRLHFPLFKGEDKSKKKFTDIDSENEEKENSTFKSFGNNHL